MSALVGKTLNKRYHVEEYVGGGGMADVYKVWDTRRSCYLAVKLMRQSLSEFEEFGERFKREADVLARLQHPNIVRFYGIERDEDASTIFMVMDYVDGPTLATKLKTSRGPLSANEIVPLVDDIAAALTFAHEHGIIHRDIKPSNILISRDGRGLLSDFGIAHLSDAITMTYHGVGTPAYMSPEHCTNGELTPASDIYALGVVLYEALTGRRPFLGDSRGEAPTTASIMREHIEMPPPAPSEINAGIRPELEAVLLKCLAKDPSYRYSSAADLAAELHRASGIRAVPALRVTSMPGGAEVTIDGRAAGVTPLELQTMRPGRHQIKISRRGYQDFTQTIQWPDQREIEARLETAPPPPPPPPQPSARPTASAMPSPPAAATQAVKRSLPPARPSPSLSSERTVAVPSPAAGGIPPKAPGTTTGGEGAGGWRRPWLFGLLGSLIVLVAVSMAVIALLMSGGSGKGGGDDSSGTPTSTAKPTATRTPAPTLTPKPTPTLTQAPPSPPKQFKQVEYVTAEGADAETGTIIRTFPVDGLTAGNGRLRVIVKDVDGQIRETSVNAYEQVADVNGSPIRGDSAGSLNKQADQSYARQLPVGTYTLRFGVDGYDGPWNYNYRVEEGQETEVTLIVSGYSIIVKDWSGAPLKPNVQVYFQNRDVNGEPIRGDSVTSSRIPDTGKLSLLLAPGRYWIEFDSIDGVDWGRADNEVRPATRTSVELRLGSILYRSTSYECISVRGQSTNARGERIVGETEYASECVDTSFGGTVIDLVPGTYAVTTGDRTAFDVLVQPGEQVELDASNFR